MVEVFVYFRVVEYFVFYVKVDEFHGACREYNLHGTVVYPPTRAPSS